MPILKACTYRTNGTYRKKYKGTIKHRTTYVLYGRHEFVKETSSISIYLIIYQERTFFHFLPDLTSALFHVYICIYKPRTGCKLEFPLTLPVRYRKTATNYRERIAACARDRYNNRCRGSKRCGSRGSARRPMN